MYKEIDLFGGESVRLISGSRKRVNLFTDHDAFIEKFAPKKTTDDCYTPKEVFDVVLGFVSENFDLLGKSILRPFFPGGDFEAIEYPESCVVVDNPPFSIITKIVRFYIDKNIPFFLFAPHLTLFSSDLDCTHIVVGGNITYENGATVKTSFLSNMFGEAKIIGDANLYKKLEQVNDQAKKPLPKYKYPNNVLTVSAVSWMVEKGVSISISKKDARHCKGLDSQKAHGKAIFGSGFLISEKAAAEKAAAEKVNVMEWQLSDKEWRVIRSLG